MPRGLRANAVRLALLTVGLCVATGSQAAEERYDPGASDTEIRIGQTMPYSGPASAWSVVGKVEAAYFEMINDQGGVNGRKIRLISLDDGYSPPKTVEHIRKLVEDDEVLFVFQTVGTAPNSAVQKYLNDRQIPQLLVAARSAAFEDPERFPWTIGFAPTFATEARVYARFILDNYPNARVGMLYENDDAGKEAVAGLRSGLGAEADRMIVGEASYNVTDPTVTSQVVQLKAAGADVLVDMATPKFAAQVIRKLADLDWQPVHLLGVASASIGAVLSPAGLENSQGIISASSFKEATDPTWADDAGMHRWFEFMDTYYPEGDRNSVFSTFGYSAAELLVRILEQCGDDLTRENVMKQAADLEDVNLDLLLPGITISTSPTDYHVIEQFQLMRFTGERWESFGSIIGDE